MKLLNMINYAILPTITLNTTIVIANKQSYESLWEKFYFSRSTLVEKNWELSPVWTEMLRSIYTYKSTGRIGISVRLLADATKILSELTTAVYKVGQTFEIWIPEWFDKNNPKLVKAQRLIKNNPINFGWQDPDKLPQEKIFWYGEFVRPIIEEAHKLTYEAYWELFDIKKLKT